MEEDGGAEKMETDAPESTRKFLEERVTNQVSGVCLKNSGTLMVTVLTFSSTVQSAMVLLQENYTVITEEKKIQTTIFVYFEFAVIKTGSKVLLIKKCISL